MIIFKFIVLLFSLQSFVLDKDEIKAKLNEIIPDEISVDIVEDTYSPNFFSVELSDGSLFYVTADGEFIINGDLYQIEKNSLINFSDMRDSKKRINRILEINPSEFITFEPKEKKTDIYVFTDVDAYSKDISHKKDYDYVLINDNVENCLNELKKIVSKHYNLAKEFNARGTPTIILENGFLLAGYHSAEEILNFLKK